MLCAKYIYNRNVLLKNPVDLELIVLTVVCYWLSILLPSPQPPTPPPPARALLLRLSKL